MLAVGTATLRDLVRRRVDESPARRWLRFEGPDGVAEFSWRRSARSIERIAGALTVLGVRPGDAVHVNLANCPEFVHTWLAATSI